MTTQYTEARGGGISDAMRAAADRERVGGERIRDEVAAGRAVLPANPAHTLLSPVVVGRAFTTKVNANIGRSPQCSSRSGELEKLQVALSAGADFVMDLSVGPDVSALRRALLDVCPAPFGTVPIYEAFSRAGGDVRRLDADLLLEVISEQAADGTDFMTIHAGLLRDHIPLAAGRMLGVVSRGGAILAGWMVEHERENPFYERWDDVMDICLRYDVTVSLGDGLRPGCLADASDAAQFAELDVLGQLVRRCRDRGVQVMVEGPGHVPFDQIQANMEREQQVCDHAPFYVLGPLVTDVAPGYDHITAAIGATAAAFYGASLLCYVTPAEHLGLPTLEEVRKGVMGARIAAHAADAARGLPGARDWDDNMAKARMDFDWNRQFELAMDRDTAQARYHLTRSKTDTESDFCSMCGREYCAVRASKRLRERS